MLQFQLEGAACAIAGNRANGDERQEEGRSNFICAEGRGDHAVKRKQRIGKSRRRAPFSARFRVRANSTDEGHAHQRTDHRQHDPP